MRYPTSYSLKTFGIGQCEEQYNDNDDIVICGDRVCEGDEDIENCW